jgi:hypothetical protein
MDERVTYSGKLKENSNQKKQYFDIWFISSLLTSKTFWDCHQSSFQDT